MNTTSFFKDAVNAIVDELPDSAVIGYRCILSTDNVIYEKQGDGSWLQDSDHRLGSQASLIGYLGNETGDVKYLNAEYIRKIETTFYGDGNTMENVCSCFWGDRRVIARSDKVSASDIIVIMPTGDANKKEFTGVITNIFADSLLNLWILSYNTDTDDFLDKIPYSNAESVVTHYLDGDGSLPCRRLSHMCSIGREIWAVNDPGDGFTVVHYDGYKWEDLTEQLIREIAQTQEVLNGATVNDIYVDADGLVLIAMYKSGKTFKLISYDGVIFRDRNVAAGITYIKKIIKVGLFVYTIINDDSIIVWDYESLTVYSTLGGTMTGLITDGVEVIAYKTAGIYKARAGVNDALTSDTVTGAALTELTGGINLIHVGAAVGKRTYLNLDAPVIISGDMTEKWVEV